MADLLQDGAAPSHGDRWLRRFNGKRHQGGSPHPPRAQRTCGRPSKAESEPRGGHYAHRRTCGRRNADARRDIFLSLPRRHLRHGIPARDGRPPPIRRCRRRHHDHRQHRSRVRDRECDLYLCTALRLLKGNSLPHNAPRSP